MEGFATCKSEIKFGTDGWRGIISDSLTFENVRVVAQAIADYLQGINQGDKVFVIGYDTRFLSRQYAEECARVVAANKIKVFLTDKVAPTPVVSYGVKHLQASGAIMVTASHNPAEYNGIKFKAPYGGSALPEIITEIEKNLYCKPVKIMNFFEALNLGIVQYFNADEPYLNQVRRFINFDLIKNANLKVVIDPMYGAGAGYVRTLLENTSVSVTEIRGEKNPGFGDISPEPIAKNLDLLKKIVLEEQADIGLATDGDGDRLGAIDNHGSFVNSHQIYALFLRYLVEQRKWSGGAVKTFSTSKMIDCLVKKYDIPVYETPIGFKYICALFLKKDILVGGEESGGIGFKNHIPERDGILSSLLLLELMAAHRKNLREILDDLMNEIGPFYYERVDLHISNERKKLVLDLLRNNTPDKIAGIDVIKVETMDGVKCHLATGGWILFRSSGTEPVVRIYVEGSSPAEVQSVLKSGISFVEGK
ncbi:phosphoglucomutase/phosphomannomutase family protein [Candidatus Formimonas warabiya]|uniref:Phosphoglucomutase n=1 Tax=Formimonas warabiya TaxID=1761012 RepID=A0A3G1KYZ1_FORW1|nr:phosphoglucomutase/phosphomannomutase family protein [Candidatus Formimonas warabiya]ATW27726.1 phosphoglucosamine mutase [Candidatus Formimonas warabiya]